MHSHQKVNQVKINDEHTSLHHECIYDKISRLRQIKKLSCHFLELIHKQIVGRKNARAAVHQQG